MEKTQFTVREPEVVHLPFVVRKAQTESDFKGVYQLRAQAYGRNTGYQPEFIASLLEQEEEDVGADILVAVKKDTGEVIGSMRLRFRSKAVIELPEGVKGTELGTDDFLYTDRFSAASGEHSTLVATSLMKAYWLFALESQVPWMVAYALAPLARRYRLVGLRSLKGEESGFHIPERHSGRYYAMAGYVPQVHCDAAKVSVSFGDVLLNQIHPDIEFDVSRVSAARQSAALLFNQTS